MIELQAKDGAMNLKWMLPAVISLLLAGCDTADKAGDALVGTTSAGAAWAPSWVRVGPTPDVGSAYLDSLGGKLAFLTAQPVVSSTFAPDLWWRTGDSTWTKRSLPVGSSPVFWNGKLWWMESDTLGLDTFVTSSIRFKTYEVFPRLDKVVIHGYDGELEDSFALSLDLDTLNRLDLAPDGSSLSLIGMRAQQRTDGWTDRKVYLVAGQGWVSRGAGWSQDETKAGAWWYRMNRQLGVPGDGELRRIDGASTPALLNGGSPLLLSRWEAPSNIDAATFSTLRSNALAEYSWLTVPKTGAAGYGKSLFVLTNGAVWRVPVDGGDVVSIESPSSSLVSLQVWRGKLLVSDGVTLWSASLEGAP